MVRAAGVFAHPCGLLLLSQAATGVQATNSRRMRHWYGSDNRLAGIGGIVESVKIPTQLRLPRDDGGTATFRGEYAAFTQLEALDMSILGRDITDMFAVIIDRPDNVVALIRQPHQYAIQSA